MLPFILSMFVSAALAASPGTAMSPGMGQSGGGGAVGGGGGGGAGGAGGGESDMMQHWTQIAAELELDQKQRDALEKLYYEARMARADLTAKEEKAQIELERLMMSNTFDEKACTKAFEAQLSADAELRRNRYQLQLGLRKILTPAQWTQLSLLRSEQAANVGRGRTGGENRGGTGMQGGGSFGGGTSGGTGGQPLPN